MAKLFANSGDPDQNPSSAAADLGIHCLYFTLFVGIQTKIVYETLSYTNFLRYESGNRTQYIWYPS